ncbi:hypothetical protein ACWM35_18730 [Neobacillus sp. K501]
MGRKIVLSLLSLLICFPGIGFANTGMQVGSTSVEINNTNEQTNPELNGQGIDGNLSNTSEVEVPGPQSDYTAPILDSVELSSTELNLGEELVVTLTAHDDSEIRNIIGYLTSPSGKSNGLNFIFNEETQKWIGTFTIDSNTEPGEWRLNDIYLSDINGNSDTRVIVKPFTVNNPDADYLEPVLDTVELSSDLVNNGEDLVVSVTAHDDKSGVSRVWGLITSPSGISRYLDFEYNEDTDKWTSFYTISLRDEAGEWKLSEINVEDSHGNINWERIEKTFTVHNPDADFTEPVLDSLVVSPNLVKVGEKVKVTVNAHDDKGITEARVNLETPNEGWVTINLSYNESTDEWVGERKISYSDKPGKWTVGNVWLEDQAGNYSVNYSEGSFIVENPYADATSPVISNIKITPSIIQVGEKVTITADVTDDKAGVRNVIAELNHELGDYKEISLVFNPTTQKWTGSFEAQESTIPGDWSISIMAEDKQFNRAYQESVQSIKVINDNGDYTGPVINEVIVPNEVKSGEQITISANVEDEQSEVGSVWAYVSYVGNVTFKYDSTTGNWVGTAKVPTNIPNGEEIFVYDINAFDLKGNYTEQWLEDKSAIVHNLTGDYTAPKLEDVQISSLDVVAGQGIQVKAKISDGQSGLKEVGAIISSGDQPHIFYLNYDEASGMWIGNYTFSKNAMPGQMELQLSVLDHNNNSDFIHTEQYISISNPDFEETSPVIENIEVTPASANVGDEVTISVSVTDNESGVDYVEASLQSLFDPNGSMVIPLTYEKDQDKWIGNYKVMENDSDGLWEVSIFAADRFKNTAFASKALQINNPDGDSDSPSLEYIKVSSPSAKVGETVHFETKLSDFKSGVQFANILIKHTDSDRTVKLPLSYDKVKDVWAASYTIPAYSTAGLQQIGLEAMDFAGNEMWELEEQRLWIFNENPDEDAPIVGEISFTPSQVSAGDTVQFKVPIHDASSGVKNASASLVYGAELDSYEYYVKYVRDIDLKYDEEQNAWIGTYTVKPTDTLGSWNIHVMTEDLVGNFGYESLKQSLVISDTGMKSPKYDEAIWYYSTNSFYNAVYFSAAALDEGDHRAEVQDLLNRAAKALFDSAATMTSEDAGYAYELLVSAAGVPSEIKLAAEAKLAEPPVVISPKYNDAAWYYSVGSYYNAVYYVGAAIAEGDKRAEVQDLMNKASKALFDAATSMTSEDAGYAYELLVSAAGVPSEIKSAAEAKLAEPAVVISPKYNDAAWYYSVGSYYNAVYYAGAAIAEGDKRAEVQDLMNKASKALFDAATSMISEDAGYAYELLVSVAGVPSEIKSAAEAKLAEPPVVISSKYNDAAWYYSVNNYYNAVHFAGAAIAEGDKRVEVQDLMNKASKALFDAATTMTSEDAGYAYELLVSAAGVPSEIKSAAEAKFAEPPVVISPKYNDAAWYYSVNNYYNAVYFAGAAIAEGDKREEVQDLMNKVSKALFDAATTMTSEDAGYAYELLISASGVPSEIKSAAEVKLAEPLLVISPKYNEASWYYSVNNFYNAVFFAGVAISEGDKRSEVQDLMNKATKALLDATTTMTSEDAGYAYQLLVDTVGVPSVIKELANSKLVN